MMRGIIRPLLALVFLTSVVHMGERVAYGYQQCRQAHCLKQASPSW